MANTEVEKSSYGAFERFLFFATPIIFTLVLLGVLFALFDTNFMNGILRAANRVPVLEKLVPDAQSPLRTASGSSASVSGGTSASSNEGMVEQLKQQLAEVKAELERASGELTQKDMTIDELKDQIADLEQQLEQKKQSDEEYSAQIRQLASIYAGMMASKAAPILENMTLRERVLVLNEMKPADRGKILERMTPAVAAETSIQMKDVVPAKDLQIAALQERLNVNKEQPQQQSASTITRNDLGQTFSQMVPKSAAAILIEMNAASPARVVEILKAMDSAGRAKVLAAISDVSKQTAASLSATLEEQAG